MKMCQVTMMRYYSLLSATVNLHLDFLKEVFIQISTIQLTK